MKVLLKYISEPSLTPLKQNYTHPLAMVISSSNKNQIKNKKFLRKKKPKCNCRKWGKAEMDDFDANTSTFLTVIFLSLTCIQSLYEQ